MHANGKPFENERTGESMPIGKHLLGRPKRSVFGTVRVGDKGQIVIPKEARRMFDIQPGDNLIVLGDEGQGIALVKEKGLLEMLHMAQSSSS